MLEAGGAALIFLRLELALLRAAREVLHLGRDRGDALGVGADDDRRDQARRDRDRDRNVGAAVFDQLVAGEADVAVRHLDQGLRQRLDQQIVDRQLHAAALEAGVELAAKLQQRVELDVDRQVDVRDLLLRFGQTARDRLADVRKLDRLVRDRRSIGPGSTA